MPRKLSEAPGLDWKTQGGIRVPRWRARKNAVKLGYRPSVIRLDLDPGDHAAIAKRCREEWAKMEAWLRAEHRPASVFDGTFGSLIDTYASDPESPYRELKYSTQQAYDDDLKIPEEDGWRATARQVDRRGFPALVSQITRAKGQRGSPTNPTGARRYDDAEDRARLRDRRRYS
jgi:hypothetical protein